MLVCHPDVSSSVVYITTNLRRDYITTNLFSLFRSTYLPSFPNILTIIFYLLTCLRFHFSKKMVLNKISKQWVSFSDSSLIILELTRGRQLGFRLLFLVLIDSFTKTTQSWLLSLCCKFWCQHQSSNFVLLQCSFGCSNSFASLYKL